MMRWAPLRNLNNLVPTFADQASLGLTRRIEFDTSWPLWATLLVGLIAGLVTIRLYRRESGSASKRTRMALALIRIALIGLIVVMIHEPRQQFYKTELPYLLLFVDNSQSMATLEETIDDDEPKSRLERTQEFLLNQMVDSMDQRYRLKLVTLDDSVHDSPNLKALKGALKELEPTTTSSPLGARLRELQRLARLQNAAAIVVFSDGITTEGPSLADAFDPKERIPIFTVSPKPTPPAFDLRIEHLEYEPLVFAGDLLTFRFRLVPIGCAGMTVTARLQDRDTLRVLDSVDVNVTDETTHEIVEFSTIPNQRGTGRYQVEIVPLESETNVENNRMIAEVQIRDDVLNVLLIQNAPSYEYRFLRSTLMRQAISVQSVVDETRDSIPVRLQTVLQESDIEVASQDDTLASMIPTEQGKLSEFDVILFGDVDPSLISQASMREIVDFVKIQGKGIVFFSGPNYTPVALFDTPLAELFPFQEATHEIESNDGLSVWSIEPSRVGQSYRPLQALARSNADRRWNDFEVPWHVRVSNLKPGVRVMANLTDTETNSQIDDPAITLHYVGRGKVVCHFFDSLYTIRAHGNEGRFANYWLTTIRFLSQQKLQADEGPSIRITPDPPKPGSPIEFEVHFPDDRMAPPDADILSGHIELVESGAATLRGQLDETLENYDSGVATNAGTMATDNVAESGNRAGMNRGKGRQWPVAFNRQEDRGRFVTSVPKMPSGRFRLHFGEPHQPLAEFEFEIAKLNLEAERFEPESLELEKIAQLSGGKSFESESRSIDKLLQMLPDGDRVQVGLPIEKPIWNSPWIAMLFIILLCLEWTLRRSVGML